VRVKGAGGRHEPRDPLHTSDAGFEPNAVRPKRCPSRFGRRESVIFGRQGTFSQGRLLSEEVRAG
jgi:hypothetical protein